MKMTEAVIVAIIGVVGPILLYLVQQQRNKRDVISHNKEGVEQNKQLLKDVRNEMRCNFAEFGKSFNKYSEAVETLSSGQKALLRHALHEDYKKYMSQGYIRSLQLREFEEAYEIYRKEGGNGTAIKWLHDIENLPIKDL